MVEGQNAFEIMTSKTLDADLNVGFGLMMMRRGAIIGAMLGLSCVLSILLVLLLRAFPKPVFYALIGISFAAEILLVVVGFLICDYGLGISFIAITIIQAVLLGDWAQVC